MIIELSGPAGSGKGTLSKMLSLHLGLPYYDFGLLFRAIAYANLQVQHLQLVNSRILFKGTDLTEIIQREEIGLIAARIARDLKDLAISFVKHSDFICDGRTCGTEIYPNADYKFYITAEEKERFHRRRIDNGNIEIMLQREMLDKPRLIIPNNAIIIDTTAKIKEESLVEILFYIKSGKGG